MLGSWSVHKQAGWLRYVSDRAIQMSRPHGTVRVKRRVSHGDVVVGTATTTKRASELREIDLRRRDGTSESSDAYTQTSSHVHGAYRRRLGVVTPGSRPAT